MGWTGRLVYGVWRFRFLGCDTTIRTCEFDNEDYIHSALNLAGGSRDIRTKVVISIRVDNHFIPPIRLAHLYLSASSTAQHQMQPSA